MTESDAAREARLAYERAMLNLFGALAKFGRQKSESSDFYAAGTALREADQQERAAWDLWNQAVGGILKREPE